MNSLWVIIYLKCNLIFFKDNKDFKDFKTFQHLVVLSGGESKEMGFWIVDDERGVLLVEMHFDGNLVLAVLAGKCGFAILAGKCIFAVFDGKTRFQGFDRINAFSGF